MRRLKNNYSNRQLKSGYEAMGQINLGFAETGIEGDAKDLISYESKLANSKSPWAGDNRDD
jgi:ribosome modulation factor